MVFLTAVNLLELNFTIYLWQRYGIRFVFDVRLQTHDVHKTLEAGNSFLKLRTHMSQFLNCVV